MEVDIRAMTIDDYGEVFAAKCNLFVFAANNGAMEFWRKLGWRCYDDFGVKAMTFNIE